MLTTIKKIEENCLKELLKWEEEREKWEQESQFYEAYKTPPKQQFSFGKRLLNRKEYQTYQQKHEASKQFTAKNIEWYKNYTVARETFKGQLLENVVYWKREEIEAYLETLKNAKTLKDLGQNYETAKAFLEKCHEDVVLQKGELESDALHRVQIQRNEAYQEDAISSYVLVHLTDYPPQDNQIKTMQDKGVRHQIHRSYLDYEIEPMRPTTHLCVNSEVDNANFSSWDDKKYAVLIPMTEVLKQKILSANEADFEIEGSVPLNERCYCLCPQGEEEAIKKENPGLQVVAYQGENVRGLANEFLSEALGYTYHPAGQWGYIDREAQDNYRKVMEQHGFHDFSAHTDTPQKATEALLQSIRILAAIEEGAKEHRLQLTTEEQRDDFQADVKSCVYQMLIADLDTVKNLPPKEQAQAESFFGKSLEEKIKEEVAHKAQQEFWLKEQELSIVKRIQDINGVPTDTKNIEIEEIQKEAEQNASKLIMEEHDKSQKTTASLRQK